ncbi:hypothetical protein Sme01_19070 [Sphaerisporangium melleum]|uniref:HTH IS21-type domain-containing protein n=1 Tax=Sphaerisporangium melleum TaxID=321316 RepID=A0A917VNL3_9ACTN|nr:helix-turn-helix domain-containing protein [Sphaerisporangium melleum]GGL03168.1 hypothetical protein GCM10007964_51580 [Sphaerisporangium melleum]GII69431.1 hypothetical protein Sme01_19070 [Sphaerisporangium melleum]
MLTWGEDVEAHALRKRGWTISAIARHLGRDRKTIAAYLNGTRVPGRRRTSVVDPFAVFEEYCRVCGRVFHLHPGDPQAGSAPAL